MRHSLIRLFSALKPYWVPRILLQSYPGLLRVFSALNTPWVEAIPVKVATVNELQPFHPDCPVKWPDRLIRAVSNSKHWVYCYLIELARKTFSARARHGFIQHGVVLLTRQPGH